MTFEERMDRLAERHEALVESVELMGHRLDTIITAINQDAEAIRALTRIAEMHERRIERIEEGQ